MIWLEGHRVESPTFTVTEVWQQPMEMPSFDILTERDEIMHHGTNMTMTFLVKDLLETLKKNLKEHKQIVKEAQAGFKKALVAELQEMLKKAKKGENFERRIHSAPPADYSRDYERTIGMLEMTTDQELELTGDQFECYVMDRWGWQQQFLAGASMYSNVASAKLMSM